MAWGQSLAAVSAENRSLQRVAAERTAARHLAAAVREYIRTPTSNNREAMERALANFDEVRA